MPHIKIRDNEPFDIALRRFRRLIEKTGVITDARKKEFYEKPTWRKKREKAAAVKRWLKKSARARNRNVRYY